METFTLLLMGLGTVFLLYFLYELYIFDLLFPFKDDIPIIYKSIKKNEDENYLLYSANYGKSYRYIKTVIFNPDKKRFEETDYVYGKNINRDVYAFQNHHKTHKDILMYEDSMREKLKRNN